MGRSVGSMSAEGCRPATIRIAEQVGSRGYFVSISLSAKWEDGADKLVVRYGTPLEHRWRAAIEFGIWRVAQFLTFVPKRMLVVDVADFRWMVADTTMPLVVLATTQCLCQALDLQPDGILLDRQTGLYTMRY